MSLAVQKWLHMLHTFQWTGFDVSGMLPEDWRQSIAAVAMNADFRDFPRTPQRQGF